MNSVSEPFAHPILHSLPSSSRSRINLLFLVVRIRQLGFQVILDCFEQFLFLVQLR